MTPRINTGRVVIGLAYVPPPRRIESGDELRLQAALLDHRTSRPTPALQKLAAALWRWL